MDDGGFQAKPKLCRNRETLCAAWCRIPTFFVWHQRNACPSFSSCRTATRSPPQMVTDNVEILVTPKVTALSTNRLPAALFCGLQRTARPVPGVDCRRDEVQRCSQPAKARPFPGCDCRRCEDQRCSLPAMASPVPGLAKCFPRGGQPQDTSDC